MKVLIFDCQDSFTYNLVHQIREILAPADSLIVQESQDLNLNEVNNFDRIILSPGPGVPEETANLLPLIKKWAPHKPVLGVCLGHQALAQVFGAKLINLASVYHGIKSQVFLKAQVPLFAGLPQAFEAGRYHSWLVDENSLPQELLITAVDQNGLIMGLSHECYDVHGVQFHPESILTPYGPKILENFLYPNC